MRTMGYPVSNLATLRQYGWTTEAVAVSSDADMGFRPVGLAGKPRCTGCGKRHSPARMGQKQPPPPGVCCQKDPQGNTVCSNGRIYPPG
jgi:hypothetical protein